MNTMTHTGNSTVKEDIANWFAKWESQPKFEDYPHYTPTAPYTSDPNAHSRDLAHCMFCDAIMFKNKALDAWPSFDEGQQEHIISPQDKVLLGNDILMFEIALATTFLIDPSAVNIKLEVKEEEKDYILHNRVIDLVRFKLTELVSEEDRDDPELLAFFDQLSAVLDIVTSCVLRTYIPRGDDLNLSGKFQLVPLTGLIATENLMKKLTSRPQGRDMRSWKNFGGHFDPEKILLLYAMHLNFMGNHKMCFKVLNKILGMNDKIYDARYARLETWFSLEFKSSKELFQEAKTLQQKLHKHDKHQANLHTMITWLIIENPSLGTLEDSYYESQGVEMSFSSNLYSQIFPPRFTNDEIAQNFCFESPFHMKLSTNAKALQRRIDKTSGQLRNTLIAEWKTKMKDFKTSKRNYCCLHCNSYDRKLMMIPSMC